MMAGVHAAFAAASSAARASARGGGEVGGAALAWEGRWCTRAGGGGWAGEMWWFTALRGHVAEGAGGDDEADPDEAQDDAAAEAPDAKARRVVYRVQEHAVYGTPVVHVRGEGADGAPMAHAHVLELVAAAGGNAAAFSPDVATPGGRLVLHPCGGAERTALVGEGMSEYVRGLAWYTAVASAAAWPPLRRADFARLQGLVEAVP